MYNQGGNYYCGVCNLDFTSQPIMDDHLAGSKHQRRIEGNELLLKLKSTETCFTQDEETGKLTCLVCFIELTSPQLLQAHLQGSKHKNKVNPPAENATAADSTAANSTPADTPSADSTAANGTGGGKRSADGVDPPPAKKRNPIPGTEKYFCDTCNAGSNSQVQWDQHVNSKKHKNKVAAAAGEV